MIKILKDKIDFDSFFYPQYILGNDLKCYPIVIGREENNFYSIWIEEKYYDKINFTKPLIILHNSEIPKEVIEEILDSIKNTYIESASLGQEHIHVFSTFEEMTLQ